jgi:flagellar protein FliO/FliZ
MHPVIPCSARNLRRTAAAAAGSSLLPVVAAASEIGAPALPAPVGGGDLLSVAASLTVVIGAIVLCGWLYRRTQGLGGASGGVFSIVASQALGPKERIVVIEVADRQLVLGMTATQISTLHVFDTPVIQRPAGLRTRAGGANFAERLKAILRGGGQ